VHPPRESCPDNLAVRATEMSAHLSPRSEWSSVNLPQWRSRLSPWRTRERRRTTVFSLRSRRVFFSLIAMDKTHGEGHRVAPGSSAGASPLRASGERRADVALGHDGPTIYGACDVTPPTPPNSRLEVTLSRQPREAKAKTPVGETLCPYCASGVYECGKAGEPLANSDTPPVPGARDLILARGEQEVAHGVAAKR